MTRQWQPCDLTDCCLLSQRYLLIFHMHGNLSRVGMFLPWMIKTMVKLLSSLPFWEEMEETKKWYKISIQILIWQFKFNIVKNTFHAIHKYMLYLKLDWNIVLISVTFKQIIFGDKWKKLKLINCVQHIENNFNYY